MASHNKSPVQYAGKSILLRELITCEQCGCSVIGDIKKKKYIYYSCNNSRGICSKKWIREEKLLEQLLSFFDQIQLPDALIDDIVTYLKKSYENEQKFFKNSQEALRKELDQIQNRVSKLIDMHIDGTIDSEVYHSKLEEYKKRQRSIANEMREPVKGDENCLITEKTVLDLARISL